jgi:hypothetical protein
MRGGIEKDCIPFSIMAGGVSNTDFRATKGSGIYKSFIVLTNYLFVFLNGVP